MDEEAKRFLRSGQNFQGGTVHRQENFGYRKGSSKRSLRDTWFKSRPRNQIKKERSAKTVLFLFVMRVLNHVTEGSRGENSERTRWVMKRGEFCSAVENFKGACRLQKFSVTASGRSKCKALARITTTQYIKSRRYQVPPPQPKQIPLLI